MFTPIESQILDHLDYAIRSSSYKLDAHEQSCFSDYSRKNIGFGLVNFLVFGVCLII